MVEIRETPMGKKKGGLKDFLEVVDYIYRDDDKYIRPLDMDLGDRLNPKKNPFFGHAEGTIFTAYKNGKCVGRVTAQIDREHLERHKDETGFFGFLDTTDDPEVAKELLAHAEDWLRARGMKQIRGPLSLSINEELGCLIEGFDYPPALMMPHHRPYQAGLIEQAGYEKEKDFYAWRYEVGEMSARVRKAQAAFREMPEVTIRPMSMKDLDRDVEIVMDIFNDAWAENWGFVPATRDEAKKMAADFKLVLVPELTRIVFIEGEPAAFSIAIPNVTEIVSDLHGKLLPFGFLKLLYRLKVEGPKSARVMLLGIRKKFRFSRKYAPMSAYLYAELNDGGKRCGMTWGELSWTLEDNSAVNTGIRMVGARKYKTYRVFKKSLVS
jgi:hypothetical protein